MNKYRVVMYDTVNGQKFNFAMVYIAESKADAFNQADDEFSCYIVSITPV